MAASGPLQLTLGIIKPSVAAHQPHVQEIMQTIKRSGLEIVRSKRIHWREQDAEEFYGEHRGRFYFPRLVFENWDTTWWIDQRNKGVEFL
uniref:Nucleoside diphosphate kinase n=1 Tax=Rhodotorula toruloides TaxID=5286 RepID=A0A0K3C743_RHOTO